MKKLLAISLILVFALSVFAGCTQPADTTPTPTVDATNNDEADATPAPPEGSTDNILKMGISSIGGIFNPIMSDQVYDSYVCSLVFDGLVDNNAEGEYIPDLADWELSNENKTYTFTLKDGLKFSDGTDLTTADVEFTYKTIASPEYDGPRPYAVSALEGYEAFNKGEADEFTGIKVIDEKQISFTFVQASPANIQHFEYGILSKDYYAYETWEDFLALNDQPMGCGKMIFDSWALNEHVTLDTNADYWNAERALKIDGVVMLNVPEDSLISAMTNGEIDFGQPSATQDNYDQINGLEGVNALTYMGNGYTYMCFNTKKDTLSDVKVRHALMYALDRQGFIDAYYGHDMASVGVAPISPVSWAYPKDVSALNDYAFDMVKAADLMDEAGWEMGDDGYRYKDGKKFSVNWLVYEDSPWPAVLAGMAFDSWKELGVELVIENMDFITVQEQTSGREPADRDFDIYTMGFSLSIDPDPSGALFDGTASGKGEFNQSGFLDAHTQELQDAGLVEFDQDKRAEIYGEWAVIQNQQIPTVIVAYRNELWGINGRVQGMNMSAYQDWTQVLPDVTITK